jgi:hypothetical protein
MKHQCDSMIIKSLLLIIWMIFLLGHFIFLDSKLSGPNIKTNNCHFLTHSTSQKWLRSLQSNTIVWMLAEDKKIYVLKHSIFVLYNDLLDTFIIEIYTP